MAVSDVSICNRALQIIGAAAIVALTDDSVRARAMNRAYESVRRAEIRRRRWSFAITRDSLAALAATPDSDYDRQFQLPNDFLRLLPGGDIVDTADLSDVRGGVSALYSIEGRTLLTNLPAPLSIRYMKDVTDPTIFDAAFVEAFAAKLAESVCEEITSSSAKLDDCRIAYREAIREASRANAFERATERRTDDSWVTCRTQ